MRIITWNCNGALRKKLGEVDSLNADLLIIQECEDPALSTQAYQDWAGSYLWVGSNKNKGVGVFPKNDNFIEKLEWPGTFTAEGLKSKGISGSWSTQDLKLFLPFRLNRKYTVLACWTKSSSPSAFNYIGQFWKYLQIHRSELKAPNTIIAGDFNSNTIWDKKDRCWNHTETVNELSEINIESLYHYQTEELQGKETQPTFFLHRNEEKPYHIDYAFMSSSLLPISSLEIGHASDWLKVSDHMPLCITTNS